MPRAVRARRRALVQVSRTSVTKIAFAHAVRSARFPIERPSRPSTVARRAAVSSMGGRRLRPQARRQPGTSAELLDSGSALRLAPLSTGQQPTRSCAARLRENDEGGHARPRRIRYRRRAMAGRSWLARLAVGTRAPAPL